jgi:hypothetical protein
MLKISLYIPALLFTILSTSLIFNIRAQEPPRLRPIQQDGKWGYIDSAGRVVIKPRFYWAEEFSEGLAAFESDDGRRYGYIDETGKVVIEPVLERWSPFSEGLAAAAIKNMEWGYIDKTGKWIIKPQFFYAQPFHEGFAAVELLPPNKDGVREIREKRSSMIDKTGKILFTPVPYVLNARASTGVAFFQHVNSSPVGGGDSKSLLIDKNGKVIFEGEDLGLDGFLEGVAPVKKQGKWGYVDITGKFVIQPQFDDVRSFSEGLAAVMIGEDWGYVDHTGKLVIPAKFRIEEMGGSESHFFSEGLALVYSGDDAVFIDKKGSAVLRPDASSVERFIGGLAAVTKRHDDDRDEERGYINKQGKFVWGPSPFRYKTTADLRAQIKKREEREGTGEKLAPLTDEEKKLNYREMVANQPDFTADMSYFRSHYVSGSGFGYKLTRKGNRFRKESQFWTFVGETGKSRVRLNPNKTYNDLESIDYETPGAASDFDPKLLAAEAETVFTPLGKITIDGHECIKIAVKRKDAATREEELYLYAARDLRNLIIAAQIVDSNATLVQRLQNISLDVPDSLVQIPPDYKPLERDVWKKVENATVKYGGKESKDFGVFRSPTGELFIWVNDAQYPWHYLAHPKEEFVETAFQGMLVTRDSKYIWQTKEAEALSDTYYRRPDYLTERKKSSNPLKAAPGSLKFQSNDSKDIWIEVTY